MFTRTVFAICPSTVNTTRYIPGGTRLGGRPPSPTGSASASSPANDGMLCGTQAALEAEAVERGLRH